MTDNSLARLLVGGLILAFTAVQLPYIAVPYIGDELHYIIGALSIYDRESYNPLQKMRAAYKVDLGHTPLLEVLLAMFWSAFDYSIAKTRIFGLAVASITLGITGAVGFRLGGWRGAAGSVLFLGASPLFFFHGRAAVPEALVTLFVSAFLLALLTGHRWGAVVAVTAAAVTKETALLVLPSAVLYYALAPQDGSLARGWRALAPLRPFVIPIGIVAAWFAIRRLDLGSTFGDFGQLEWEKAFDRLRHPRKIAVLTLVRMLQLGYFDYRWIGTLAIAAAVGVWFLQRKRQQGRLARTSVSSLPWIILGSVVVLYIVAHSVAGVSVLPRYLLPGLLAFSILSACALTSLSPRYGLVAAAVVGALYLGSSSDGSYRLGRFVMGAYDDHAESRDIVEAYRRAFRFVEDRHPEAVVATNYPGTVMAQDPRLGYVMHPHRVRAIPMAEREFENGQDLYVVASRYPASYPAWVDEVRGSGRKDFVVGQKSVTVLWKLEKGLASENLERQIR